MKIKLRTIAGVVAGISSAVGVALAYMAGWDDGGKCLSEQIAEEHKKGNMFTAWRYDGGGYSGNADIALDAIANDKGKKETPE